MKNGSQAVRVMLVGSQAMKYWYPDSREAANDFDLFIDHTILEELNVIGSNNIYIDNDLVNTTINGISYGFDNTRHQSVRELMLLNTNSPTTTILNMKCYIANPETLLTIKRSHMYYRRHWHKHASDFVFLKSKGVEISNDFEKIMQIRMQERAKRNDYKISNSLNTSNEEFFARSENKLKRKFKHDDLHLIVSYGQRPIFESLKLDHRYAALNHGLFKQLAHTDKIKLVREEAYVIGLERIIIPLWNNFKILSSLNIDTLPKYRDKYLFAYRYAIMRISTDLTKGWFRDFAIENYGELADPDVDYVSKFEQAIANNIIEMI